MAFTGVKTLNDGDMPYTITDADDGYLMLFNLTAAGDVVCPETVSSGIEGICVQSGTGQLTFITSGAATILNPQIPQTRSERAYVAFALEAVGTFMFNGKMGSDKVLVTSNYAGNVPPAITDDESIGYSIGSQWFDIVGLEIYDCLDASTGAAVWRQRTSTSTSLIDPIWVDIRTVQDVLNYTTDEGDGGNARGLRGHYTLKNPLDIGDLYFVMPTTGESYSFSSSFYTLSNTSTNPLFSEAGGVVDTTLTLRDMFVTTPNSPVFNILDGTSLIIKSIAFAGCSSIGTYTGDFFTVRLGAFVGCGDGISVTAAMESQIDSFQYNSGLDTNGCGITFAGAGAGIVLSGVTSKPEATESTIDIQPSYTGIVSITGGVHTPLGNFFKGPRNQDDPFIEVNNVVGVSNSRTVGSMHVDGNALSTTIASTGTPVKVNAVWDEVGVSRFTSDNTGRMTYVGKEDYAGTVSLLCFADSGGNDVLSVYIGLNGTPVTITKGTSDVAGGGSQVATVSGIVLSEGDFIEPFVANETDTSNITVKTASFNIG